MNISPTSLLKDTELETVVGRLMPLENETQSVLRKALALLGPNGEHWHQGTCYQGDDMCAGWSVRVALGAKTAGRASWADYSREPALLVLNRAAAEIGAFGYIALNDKAKSFDEIRHLFKTAIRIAGES